MNRLRYLASRIVLIGLAQLLMSTAFSTEPTGKVADSTPAPAESEPPETIELSHADKIEQITAKREEFSKELEQAEKALRNSTTNEREAPTLQLAVDLLQRTDLVYGQQLSALETSIEFDHSTADLSAKLSELRTSGPDEARPYSFLLLDNLRDELARDKAKTENVSESINSAEKNLEQARDVFDEKEQARRLSKERFETNEDTEQIGELDSALRGAILQSKFAEEKVMLRQLELENQKAAAELHDLRIDFLEEKIGLVEPETQFTLPDLRTQLDEIAKKEEDVNDALNIAKQNLAWRETKLIEARQHLDETIDADPALTEQVETWRVARAARQAEVALLTKQLLRFSDMRQIWDRRFRFANADYSREDLSAWDADGKSALEQLGRDEGLQLARLTDSRRDLLSVENRIGSPDESEAAVRKLLQAQRSHLNQLISIYAGNLASIGSLRRLEEKWAAEIGATVGTASIAAWAASAWDTAKKVWGFEITHVDDRPITIGKVVLSILLFLLGIAAARYFSVILGRRILPSVGLSRSASMAFQSVIFYFLLVGFTLVILNILNVPLTAFTVLGGAIAIGFGFGAQNIINNFISGWILMAGQSIRVDDLIEVEHQHGHVTSIGARSTQIKRDDGIDMLVPNSHLLEHTVVNWTLTDRVIRTKVSVGVVYGSPADKVSELIRAAATDKSEILKDPAPFIIFQDFGDSSLVFSLYFWISAHSEMDVWKAQSDIRFRIDRAFREAGIVIAFPQRDVHVDAKRPIEIRMIPGASAGTVDSPQITAHALSGE